MKLSMLWAGWCLGLWVILSSCGGEDEEALRPPNRGKDWPGYFVDSAWVARHADALRLVDVRPAEEYAEGHLEGALSLPLADWHEPLEGREQRMTSAAHLEEHLSRLGLSPSDRVVVYGRASGNGAARAAWILDAYGHEHVAVLADGIEGWGQAGGPVVTEAATTGPTRYRARLRGDRVANRLSVLHAISDPRIVLLDVRRGAGGGRERGGRIPSSISFDLGESVMRPTSLASVRELQGTLKGFLRGGGRFVVYSDDGMRAALVSLALRELGAEVELYDGGWNEWAAHPNLPVEVTKAARRPRPAQESSS